MKLCARVPSIESDSRSNYSETQRRPVGIDDLAEIASLQARGKVIRHPLAPFALDFLCEAIHRMVYKLANGYSVTCKIDVDDLAQDCMKRIVQRVGGFDRRLAKFTTWSTTVCRSVLNGVYRQESGWNQNVVSATDVGKIPSECVPREEPDEASLLRMDILNAVKILVGKYPDKRKLIMGLFGHPGQKGSSLPSSLRVSEAAKEVGVSYVAARTFFVRVVKPFFEDYFSMKPSANVTKVYGLVESAVSILEEAKRPMRSKEVFNVAVSRGLFKSKAKEPYIYFVNALARALTKGEKRIVKVGPAYWAAASLKSKRLSDKPGRSRVVEGALIVLRSVNRAMSAKELFKKAVERKLYSSEAENQYEAFFGTLGKAVSGGDKRLVRVRNGVWRAVA